MAATLKHDASVHDDPSLRGTMQDGDIAVITGPSYAGAIVQRYKDYLVRIGGDSGDSWGNYFGPGRGGTMRGRILPPGSEITL